MRALNSSGYKTRGCCSPVGRLLPPSVTEKKRKRERKREEENEGRVRGAKERMRKKERERERGSCFDAYVDRRRRAATAIKCFGVHNFLNIFITAGHVGVLAPGTTTRRLRRVCGGRASHGN